MVTDAITEAVCDAINAVYSAIPSQAPSVSISGVRKTATGTRQIRGVVSCVILSSGFSDPIGDLSDSSSDKQISILVAKRGVGAWFDATDPDDGDILTFAEGDSYAVTSVSETRGLYYKIGARKC